MSQLYVFDTASGWTILRNDIVELESDEAAKALGERLLKAQAADRPGSTAEHAPGAPADLSVLVGVKSGDTTQWLGAWRWDGAPRWTT